MPNAMPPMSESLRKRLTIPAKPADPDAWVRQPPPPPGAAAGRALGEERGDA